jgi:hypothetical protein
VTCRNRVLSTEYRNAEDDCTRLKAKMPKTISFTIG